MLKKLLLLMLAAMISVSLWGCGSSRSSGGSSAGEDDKLANAATLGITNCLTCHSASVAIVDIWLNRSRHGNNMVAFNVVDPDRGSKIPQDAADTPGADPSPNTTSATCTICHDQLGDGQKLDQADINLTNRSIISCESCHGGGQYHNGLVSGIPYPTPGPDQCGTCHGLNGAELYHATSGSGDNVRRVISDSHYDDPATALIEGYNIDGSIQKACVNCHMLGHSFNLEMNFDWAQTAHAGHIKIAKDTALLAGAADAAILLANVKAAGVDSSNGAAWSFYDFKQENRASCQRCHTATGAINYLNDPANYDAVNNDFSYLSGEQREMLYCNGCHSDSNGGLRDPGALTIDYTDAPYTYPDAAGANICIGCHSGRETGDTIKASTDDFSDKGFVNSHYLAAGGTVFAVTGYTYGSRDYSIPASDPHNLLGMGVDTGVPAYDAVRDDYTEGPCVTCHFGNDNGVDDDSHTLSPFTEYTVGVDLALNPVCVNCHTSRGAGSDAANNSWFGKDFTVADLVAGVNAPHKGRYLAGLEALRVLLSGNGYDFIAGYPYFANTDWTIGISTDGMNNMGAAFNYNLMIHDPGGVAHNRRYTRRLIYDSIDHLDNGVLDYSVAATLNALVNTTTYKTSAISYLLNASNGNAGDRH